MKEMSVDNVRISGIISNDRNLSHKQICADIDMHVETLRERLRNPKSWRIKDINRVCGAIGLDPQQVLLFTDTEK